MRSDQSFLESHLEAARQGDAGEFGSLTEPYRRELQAHCYRILGSLHEAEDLVQETFLRAWRRLDTYQGRASFRTWLYKIATNACLDALERTRSRRLLPTHAAPAADPRAAIHPPAPELGWLEPFPDEWLGEAAASPEARYSTHESISLAFLVALQLLPPRQRVVLILSDVLDWSAGEIADLLGMTVSAVNSALHRARFTLAKQYKGMESENLALAPDDEQTQKLLERYVETWEKADIAGLVALLREDATLAMPPSPSWYRGREAIGAFVATTIFADGGMFPGQAPGRWLLRPCRANGQLAFGTYQRDAVGEYQAFGIQVLGGSRAGLAQIITFIDPTLLPRFGFPLTVSD